MHITLCSCASHFTGFCQRTSYALSFKQVTLQDTYIISNTASTNGGGLNIHVQIPSADDTDVPPLHCRVINSRLVGNKATENGGGLYLWGSIKVVDNMM